MIYFWVIKLVRSLISRIQAEEIPHGPFIHSITIDIRHTAVEIAPYTHTFCFITDSQLIHIQCRMPTSREHRAFIHRDGIRIHHRLVIRREHTFVLQGDILCCQ